MQHNAIHVDVVTGGFVISVINGATYTKREVVTSPRKLLQRIKELVSDLSDVADDTPAK